MPVNIVVPDLGESVTEATVARWLKQEGERVAVGEPLLSLETDKVDLEVAAERDEGSAEERGEGRSRAVDCGTDRARRAADTPAHVEPRLVRPPR